MALSPGIAHCAMWNVPVDELFEPTIKQKTQCFAGKSTLTCLRSPTTFLETFPYSRWLAPISAARFVNYPFHRRKE